MDESEFSPPPSVPPWGSVRARSHSGPNLSAVSAILVLKTRSGMVPMLPKVGFPVEIPCRTSVKNLPRSVVDCAGCNS